MSGLAPIYEDHSGCEHYLPTMEIVGTDAPTVREEVLDQLRARGLTTIFSNPGSTEVPLLSGLPDDFRFVLALHEASVVGMATGWALARQEPALVLLHTTAGLGNAVGAIATARVNRAPLVVLVGQQDRRHLALEPFLAGHLDGLAGDYPVWHKQPARAQDVASTIARACHEAVTSRGPALVTVPMDDWLAPADDSRERAAPREVLRTVAADAAVADRLAEMIAAARSPALVVGAGADDPETWSAITGLVERLGCPVWQEPFGARAGFPQDHPRFAGHLPPNAGGVRKTLSHHDLVMVVGAAAFRQYPYEPGRLIGPNVRVAVLTDDSAEAHRSVADLAVVAPLAALCEAVAERITQRDSTPLVPPRPARLPPPAPGAPMLPGHVFDALAARLPVNAVVLEESPSSRSELQDRLPARAPLGFLSAAMGGLGFAMPAAVGVRMALANRPVVAIVGDGSSLYAPQALWSAAHYEVGALFVVLQNGGYAIMDRLAARQGEPGPWPSLAMIDITNLARSFGCDAMRVTDHRELEHVLSDAVPSLTARTTPLLLEVPVAV